MIDQQRSVADVARELGLVEQTLGNWVRQERIDRGEREGTTTEIREENVRLRREVKRLTMERDLGEGVAAVTRSRWTHARKAEGYCITMLCHSPSLDLGVL